MNIPITKEQHERFADVTKYDLVYGSRLFGVHREDSDWDIISLYEYEDVFGPKQHFLPNIHSFKYEDTEKNEDRIYMTYEQFWKAFYDGDGTMYADIILFGNYFAYDALKLCRAYKIIKGYCGTAKRDLLTAKRSTPEERKKIFHRSAKNLYIAGCLIDNEYPDIEHIRNVVFKQAEGVTASVDTLLKAETYLREEANKLFNSHEIENYHIPTTDDELLNIMLSGNNLKEYIFKK
jgi:predicted nucleotidyltransferase